MNTEEALNIIENRRGAFTLVGTLAESLGPEAWDVTDDRIDKLRKALAAQDATQLGELLLEPAKQYIVSFAEDIAANPVCTNADEALDNLQRRLDMERGAA